MSSDSILSYTIISPSKNYFGLNHITSYIDYSSCFLFSLYPKILYKFGGKSSSVYKPPNDELNIAL